MRILVIATEPVDADRLASALGEDVRGAEVKVVAPAVNDSRLAFWVSDPDEAIAEAEVAQAESVERLRADGLEVDGAIGESDPLLALQDALATFDADRVAIFRHPRGEEAYREDELTAEAERRLGVPVVTAEVPR